MSYPFKHSGKHHWPAIQRYGERQRRKGRRNGRREGQRERWGELKWRWKKTWFLVSRKCKIEKRKETHTLRRRREQEINCMRRRKKGMTRKLVRRTAEGELWESECEGQSRRETAAIISPHKNVIVLAENVMGCVKTLRTWGKQHHLALSAFTPTVFCEY